jgi:UDP-N-acetylglucosamine 2-epimerase (non-hydrolysing)
MKVLHIVGAPLNFIKATPVMAALTQHPGVCQTLVHTGQHYDTNMSDVFFRKLGLPESGVNLEVGPSSHAQQTAQLSSF